MIPSELWKLLRDIILRAHASSLSPLPSPLAFSASKLLVLPLSVQPAATASFSNGTVGSFRLSTQLILLNRGLMALSFFPAIGITKSAFRARYTCNHKLPSSPVCPLAWIISKRAHLTSCSVQPAPIASTIHSISAALDRSPLSTIIVKCSCKARSHSSQQLGSTEGRTGVGMACHAEPQSSASIFFRLSGFAKLVLMLNPNPRDANPEGSATQRCRPLDP
jgi:hypothetical protein